MVKYVLRSGSVINPARSLYADVSAGEPSADKRSAVRLRPAASTNKHTRGDRAQVRAVERRERFKNEDNRRGKSAAGQECARAVNKIKLDAPSVNNNRTSLFFSFSLLLVVAALRVAYPSSCVVAAGHASKTSERGTGEP